MTKRKILLVEDDAAIASVICEALRQDGFDTTLCSTVAERNASLNDGSFDVMLTDIVLPDGDGIDDLARIRTAHPDMPIIILSAQNTLDTAVRANETGSFEYFPKPFDLDALVTAVAQAAGSRDERAIVMSEECEALPLVGRSQAMQTVYRMIARVLTNNLTVLVLGESGTGKELVAEAVHQLGHRKTGPFVAVNAAAIPSDLIESELFGHERGAFTGAVKQTIGKFEQANGGTLFLDEIGDMPLEAQTRLLRALQSGNIRRVGGQQDIATDVRIIAATNRDLEPMIAKGTFREDLFYRLNVVPIHLPPLRERRDDIAALCSHFLIEATKEGLPLRKIDSSAIAMLGQMKWRGNVRELRNAIYRLVLMARDDIIAVTDIAEAFRCSTSTTVSEQSDEVAQVVTDWLQAHRPSPGTVYHTALSAFETPIVEWALSETGGNQLKAAQLLGINRNTVRKRIVDLNINSDRFIPRTLIPKTRK